MLKIADKYLNNKPERQWATLVYWGLAPYFSSVSTDNVLHICSY